MHVLATTPSLQMRGGVATYWRTLSLRLNEIVTPFAVGSRVGEKRTVRLIRLFRDFFAFHAALRRHRYDVVHLNPSLGNAAILRDGIFLIQAKLLGAKVFVMIHGWDETYERRLRWWLPLFRAVYFRADAFGVLASEFRRRLIQMGYHGRVYVETTTVDDSFFGLAQKRPDEHNSTHDKPCTILFLARLEKAKGIYETLNAFRIIKSSHRHVRLIVAGDGAEYGNARKYSAKMELSDVLFLGYVTGESLHRAYREADIYVLPTSHGEGMPTSILEAMAYGLPIVTCPVGGIADFFEHGKMGFITESHSAEIVAQYVEKLIRSPRLRWQMGQYNQEYAYNHFSVSRVAERLTAIYHDTIGSRPASV